MIIQSLAGPQINGWYKLEAGKVDDAGNEIRRTLADWFPNLITDYGLNVLGTANLTSQTSRCHVGSGNTTPAFTDTALVSWVASTLANQDTSVAAQASAPYYWRRRVTRRFAAGVAAGNLSEVGMSAQDANGNLFSRALILDGGGSPTTITVLSDEFLDVTYELRIYPPASDGAWAVTDGATNYTGTIRAANVTSSASCSSDVAAGAQSGNPILAYNGSIGAVTTVPSGSVSSIPATNLTYSNNSLQRDFRGTFGLNDANLAGGITAFRAITAFGNFQFSVSPAIDKTNSKILENITFRCGPWARHTP